MLTFEGGGQLFPILFNRIMAAFVVAQLTIIGVMGVKGGIVQGPLLAPLLVCTIGYWYYRNKFSVPVGANLPQRVAIDMPPSDAPPEDEYIQVNCPARFLSVAIMLIV